MKTIAYRKYTQSLIITLAALTALMSCEQTSVEPQLNAAPGGGTLSSYKAYTLQSETPGNIYGRVVFWKDNANNTLVQISLYNTAKDTPYPSGLYTGSTDNTGAELISLYAIDGTTGEFGTSKFYVIDDKDFYSTIDDLDAHIRITADATLVASGNIGNNSEPVATAGN